MTLDPLVSIILLLFIIFLLAGLIIWLAIELRVMGLRDKEMRQLRHNPVSHGFASQDGMSQGAVSQGAVSQGAVSQGAVSQSTVSQSYIAENDLPEYNPVTNQDIDSALSTGLQNTSGTSSTSGARTTRNSRGAARQISSQSPTQSQAQRANASQSSTFKTPSYRSGVTSNQAQGDVFEQFAQENANNQDGQALGIASNESKSEQEHEATLLKPPKADNDIFSTSERRDDIWVFHTAEVEPVHPAEDMTKFRQPGGITGESPRSKMKAELSSADSNSADSNSADSNSADSNSADSNSFSSKDIRDSDIQLNKIAAKNNVADAPLQVEETKFTPDKPVKSWRESYEERARQGEKVVRIADSSSRVAAERLIADRDVRKTNSELHSEVPKEKVLSDVPVETKKPIVTQIQENVQIKQTKEKSETAAAVTGNRAVKPAQPSEAFRAVVPPIPKDVQQKLKQTLDESVDNVSDASKDNWDDYKNLGSTRSLISTQTDDD